MSAIQGSPVQSFIRFNDQEGNKLVSLNQDGSVFASGITFSDGTTLNAGAVLVDTAAAPISYANECQSIVITGGSESGSNATAKAIIQATDSSGVVHDLACVVTAVGSVVAPEIIFPYATGVGTGVYGAGAGIMSLASKASGGPAMVFTNASGANRHVGWTFRNCNEFGMNCGTDLTFTEDPTSGGYEEYLFSCIGGNNPIYFGNVLNSRHPGVYLGSNDASSGAVFGFDHVQGSYDHLVRLSSDTDIWGTVTLGSGGTVTFDFNRAFASPPICIATYQGTGGLTGVLSCSTTTSSMTVSSSVSSDRAVVGYLVLGNNN